MNDIIKKKFKKLTTKENNNNTRQNPHKAPKLISNSVHSTKKETQNHQ